MENRFHLAIPAGDLDKAIKFYCEVLAVKEEILSLNTQMLGLT